MSSLSRLLYKTHQSSFYSVLHKLLLPYNSDYLNARTKLVPQCAHHASNRDASYACTLQDAALHLPFYGRQVPPTPILRFLAPTINDCCDDFFSQMSYREHALVYPKPQFTDLWQSRGHNVYHNFMKCGGKPALKGMNTTSSKRKFDSPTPKKAIDSAAMV